MSFTWAAVLAAGGLCLGMLIVMWIGLRLGARRLAKHPGDKLGSSTVETAVFGLLGLLLAFVFYGAAGRFDWHRELDVDEANAIGTAYLRIDLLPEASQGALRHDVREYVGARLAFYRTMEDRPAQDAATRRTDALQQSIWHEALAACPADCNPGTKSLVFSSFNDMFDMASKQTMGTWMHPPFIMYVLLYALALIAGLLTGYSMADARPRGWLHLLALPAILAVTVYVILDVEYPRRGTIQLGRFDQVLEAMQREMGTQSVRR
jgi:hypothetical protein